jgi:hypothetical protein
VRLAGVGSVKGNEKPGFAEMVSARPNGAAAMSDKNLRRSMSSLFIAQDIHCRHY